MVKPMEPFEPAKHAHRYSPREQEWQRLLTLPVVIVDGRRTHWEKREEGSVYYLLDASNKSVASWCD